MEPAYTFSSELWEPPVEPAWVFATVPAQESDEISELAGNRPGFGSVRVEVTIGATSWKTSLFPSKQVQAYVLPVKRAVREAEGLDIGDVVTISLVVVQE